MRSDKLQKIPPRTKPSPSAQILESTLETKYRIPAATAIENPERKIVPFVAILNAAPVLKTNWSLKTLPKISMGPSIKNFTAACLVE